jgi:hypothetical protein
VEMGKIPRVRSVSICFDFRSSEAKSNAVRYLTVWLRIVNVCDGEKKVKKILFN